MTSHAPRAEHRDASTHRGRRMHVGDLGTTALSTARAVLGATIVRLQEGTICRARIVEVEAYRQDDPASHSHRGPDARNATMFGPPGRAYVYRAYGVHWCLNVVAEPEGIGAGVLIRAAEAVGDPMPILRRRGGRVAPSALLKGPGCLTRGLDVDRDRHDGLPLCDGVAPATGDGPGIAALGGDDRLWLEVGAEWPVDDDDVSVGPRVGVSRGAEVAWRWWLTGHPSVSRYRRSPRAPANRPPIGQTGG